MISVCIPVYNLDITSLVNELTKQIGLLNQPAEIVIIDDCSEQKFKEINSVVCQQHVYVELEENIGRAKIRNLFLKYVKYDYLLFLDCDSSIPSPTFLSKYVEIIGEKPAIVCGGKVNDTSKPSRETRLRWEYGNKREIRSVEVRNKFPNNSFMTNNFLISRIILDQIRFDERITQYGHEDTLFGYSLKKNNIIIRHIDNPVENGDFDFNWDYLKKTEEGIKNLVTILNFPEYQEDLQNDVALIRFYRKVKKFDGIISLLFTMHKRQIKWLLSKGFVSLRLFDFYKLGLLIEYLKKKAAYKTFITKTGLIITQLLSGRSNVFLLTSEGKNMMIDTSPRYRWPTLRKQLDALHVNHIDYLVLTHAHYDHAENASLIREQYKAKVIIHQEEAANLSNGKFLIPKGTNFATAFIVDFLVNKLALQFSSVPCQCDITVKDKLDLHDFGFNAYILHTPGHTPGSISLIVDNEIALVGDTMFGVFKWSVFPPFADNIPEMINSWGKLLATECRLFIPSHGTANKRALVEKIYKKKKNQLKSLMQKQPPAILLQKRETPYNH